MGDRYDLRSRLETEGVFWAASDPEQTFSAHLSVGKDIELSASAQIVGPEQLFAKPEDEERHPAIVHGLTGKGRCTLIGLVELGGHRTMIGRQVILSRRFRVALCMFGLHLADDRAPLLCSAKLSYAGLGDWLFASNAVRLSEAEVLIKYQMNAPPLLNFSLLNNRTRITLSIQPGLRWSPSGRHSATPEQIIGLEPRDPVSLECLLDSAFRFEDFLSLLLGTSVRLRTVRAKDSEGNEGSIIYRRRGRADKPDPQTWVRCDASQLASAIGEWFAFPDEFRPVENLVFGAIRTSSMFVETEFLSLAQALESFHRLTHQTTVVKPFTFRHVLRAVLLAIQAACDDSQLSTRLTDSIRHANEPSFRNRVEALLARLQPDNVRALVGDPLEFEQTLRQTRNSLTHPGIRRKSKVLTDTKELFLFNQKPARVNEFETSGHGI